VEGKNMTSQYPTMLKYCGEEKSMFLEILDI
jgi:hypothetical protein